MKNKDIYLPNSRFVATLSVSFAWKTLERNTIQARPFNIRRTKGISEPCDNGALAYDWLNVRRTSEAQCQRASAFDANKNRCNRVTNSSFWQRGAEKSWSLLYTASNTWNNARFVATTFTISRETLAGVLWTLAAVLWTLAAHLWVWSIIGSGVKFMLI